MLTIFILDLGLESIPCRPIGGPLERAAIREQWRTVMIEINEAISKSKLSKPYTYNGLPLVLTKLSPLQNFRPIKLP